MHATFPYILFTFFQALREKKRQSEGGIHAEDISNGEQVQHEDSSDSESSLKEGNPFRIHRKDMSSMSRHLSMDNLAHEGANIYAKRQQYSSMLNLGGSNVSARLNSNKTQSSRKSSGKKQAMKNPAASKPPIRPERRKSEAGKKPPPPPSSKRLTAFVNDPKRARDANLHHLGRMSPEEQLDKFLQSVEEVNAENELRLSKPHETETRVEQNQSPERQFYKNRNLRRETSVVNRWHSMDNLSHANKNASKPPKRATDKPKTVQPPPPKAIPEERPAPLGASVTSSSSRRSDKKHVEGGNRVAFREINGPKSFASMSQLDSIKNEQPSLLITGKKKHHYSPSPVSSQSPMEISSRTSSSTEDNNGNKKRSHKSGSSSNGSNHRRGQNKQLLSRSMSNLNDLPKQLEVSHHGDRTKIIYLGSMPLSNQASDLSSIQLPLKELYFNYMELQKQSGENRQAMMTSTLEITETGLKINYVRERHIGIQEIFNPFPTIAVWAAVRFIYKREIGQDGRNRFLFAFLPLISDPSDAEKNQLFNLLSKKDLKQAANSEHPAMFACIMRRTGVPRQLECHGFVCDSKDDAIRIASNLYKSLMETMNQQVNDQTVALEQQPQRPPRARKKGNKKSSDEMNTSTSTNESRKALVKRTQSEKMLSDDDFEDSYPLRLKRSVSERRSFDDSDATIRTRRGDIYTKVAMPRSKSFMNVSGQYNLQELFKELREKEGIESIDDILRQVINPEGMSFNKTSPMYRELLMKLAMSMSGDEMFIRSKNIMMQEKMKKQNQSTSGLAKILQAIGVGKKTKPVVSPLPATPPGILLNHENHNNRTNATIHLHVDNNNAHKSGGGGAGKHIKFNKADIGLPMPISEETKRELTKQWMKETPDLLTAATMARLMVRNSSHQNNNVAGNNVKMNKGRVRKSSTGNLATDGDSYMSCSECGYQSVCGTNCSCSILTTTADEIENHANNVGK